MSFSECFLSLRQFFVKSGLLSSRCFISKIFKVNLHTTGMNLSLKFTNRTVEKIRSAILLQNFGSGLSASGWSLCFSSASVAAFSDSESLDGASFTPRTARCAKETPSLLEFGSWLDFLLCEDAGCRSLCTCPEVRWTWHWVFSVGVINSWSVDTCLSPSVVKPAYPVIAHRENPIQEWESQCSQLNHKSMSCSVCGRTSV